MAVKLTNKLCIILEFSILEKYLTFFYMHNLKTNFEKIRRICKSVLSKYLYADGNLERYRNKPRMSDLDIIALSLTSEALGIDSENYLYGKIKSDYPQYFSNLPDRSNYNRRKRRMQKYIPWVSESIARIIDPAADRYILDSIPVPVCQPVRSSRAAICREDPGVHPSRGYHASHRLHYYGFKMQLVISRSGVPVHFGITAANVHDVNYLQWLNETQLTDCELIADKGYLSLGYQTSLFEESRIRLVTPLRANMKNRLPEWNAGYRYARKRIETLFSQLCDQLMLKRNYAKTLDGLFTRLCAKISAVAVLQYTNFLNNRNINRLKHALAV